jgi:hypothetical protein
MLGVDDYQALVQAKRPKLKPNSARTYAVSLNTIAPPDSTSADWVSDVPYVLKQLDRYKDTTKKNTLNAVIVLVEADSIAIKRYTKERDHYNDRYSDLMKAQQKTESQAKNWVSWDEYLQLVQTLGTHVKSLGTAPRSDPWSWRQLSQYQDYLLALLYSHYPLRNDFGDVRFLSKTAYNNLGDKDQGNYLITEQGGKKMTLVLNEYKTAHKYGQKRITLEPAVTKALRKWFQHNDSAYLLRTKAGQPLGSNGITKALGRIGLQHLQRRLGSSLLRHSYLSHKYKDTLDEKKEDADLMMHSVAMQEGYVKV